MLQLAAVKGRYVRDAVFGGYCALRGIKVAMLCHSHMHYSADRIHISDDIQH